MLIHCHKVVWEVLIHVTGDGSGPHHHYSMCVGGNSTTIDYTRERVSLEVCTAWLWRTVTVNAHRQCGTRCKNVQHLRVLTRYSRRFHDAVIAVVKHPTVTNKVNILFATDVIELSVLHDL